MSMTKMNIPETIRVGYQTRPGTYTGKLAYVIWIDEKGKVRKEKSWSSWRSKNIKADDFKNEPTSGFVLNKGVGGTRNSYGWNPRNEYIRVYDPRGFEFEISVANLLYILQETSSIKGKGLEGEFVYSWDGKDLVLLPTCSKEYQECSRYTAMQSKKITKDDMKEGCIYLMKDMTEVMYLGRHPYSENTWQGLEPKGKRHIFKPIKIKKLDYYGNKYISQPGFTKLAARVSDTPSSDFAKEYSDYKNSINGSNIIDIKVKKISVPPARGLRSRGFLIKKGDTYHLAQAYQREKNNFTLWREKKEDKNKKKEEIVELTYNIQPVEPKLENGRFKIPHHEYYYNYSYSQKRVQKADRLILKPQDFQEMDLYTFCYVTDKNKAIDIFKKK